MSAPTGLLIWGQGGTYDAVNDRAAITVLANGQKGVFLPTRLTAGSGLTMNIAAWRAIVDCGDGTLAIVGTGQPSAMSLTTGGAAARTDVLWADIDPINGTWTLMLLQPTDIPGRLGVEVGRIAVPANANTASQMAFTMTAKTWNPYPQPRVPRTAAGAAVLRFNKADSANIAIRFPAGRFVATPYVTVTLAHSSFFAAISSASAAGFTLWGRVFNSSKPTMSVTAHWNALEAT